MKFVTRPHPNRPNPKSPHAWDLKRRARGGACLQGNSLSVCSGLTPQRSPKGPGRPSKSVLIPSHPWCVGSMRHCPGGGMQTHFFGFFPVFFPRRFSHCYWETFPTSKTVWVVNVWFGVQFWVAKANFVCYSEFCGKCIF